MTPDGSPGYWDRVADEKTFAHPIDHELLASLVPACGRILDLGCGYGRLTAELADAGWDVVGLDPSEGMIERGLRERPELELRHFDGGRLPFDDASFDAALLFTVLTSVPDGDDQRWIVAEAERVLRPGGVLWISDLPLQDDERNLARYARFAGELGTYGVFRLSDGAVFRHHDPAWIEGLLRRFEPVTTRDLEVRTMNGNPAHAMQWIVRRGG